MGNYYSPARAAVTWAEVATWVDELERSLHVRCQVLMSEHEGRSNSLVWYVTLESWERQEGLIRIGNDSVTGRYPNGRHLSLQALIISLCHDLERKITARRERAAQREAYALPQADL